MDNNYYNHNYNFRRRNVTRLSSSPTYSPTKKNYKNVYCANCGEKGHVVKECERPITSFGIIAFKVVYSKEDEQFDKNLYLTNLMNETGKSIPETSYPKIKFLMIQRKDTMGYIDFVRGKYSMDNEQERNETIQTLMNEMTFEEKTNLVNQSFDEIWASLWNNHSSRSYTNEYELAKKKFYQLDIPKLISQSENLYFHTELGFPKGRRNMRETNISCAEREFYEETGYNKSNYDFIKNYNMIEEEFVGTNGITYRHIYYLVKMKSNVSPPCVDKTNKVQTGEVKNIGWFTLDECISVLRPYDQEKGNVLRKVYDDLVKMNFNFQLSDFYTNFKADDHSDDQFHTDADLYDFTENVYLYTNSHLIDNPFNKKK